MTASEHLLVLFSIVLGLALTELLSSFHHLIHPSAKVKWHWMTPFWAINAFLSIVFWWWTMSFFGRLEELPNIFSTWLILMGPVLLYLMATSVFPDAAIGEAVDMREFHFQNRRRYFTLAALYVVILWLYIPIFGWNVPPSQHAWAAGALTVCLTLRRSSSVRVHTALAVVQALMTLAALSTVWLEIK